MMRLHRLFLAALAGALLALAVPGPAPAQELATDDPVIQRIWDEGMNDSRVRGLAQTLLDSLGPRLTGSPGQERAAEWVLETYDGWGIEARNEVYGTWEGWERGITHVDLLQPRIRTLEATQLAWSPASGGAVSGPVLALPEMASRADFVRFLRRVEGSFVLISFAQPTCRPDESWEEWAAEGDFEQMDEAREAARSRWESSVGAAAGGWRRAARAVEAAGAAGVLTSRWSRGWGVQKIFGAPTRTVPAIDLSCEDYGLLHRLATNGQGPRIRVRTESTNRGQVPVANTLGVIPGTSKPDEYVLLSAHFDSWDGASGATDNGTGTVTMMEAMRILKTVLPEPSRTIMVGHWNGEEQGLNGSRAFAADHPEVVDGLQALFNQDNGTGRVARIGMQGLLGVGAYFARWMEKIPADISEHVELRIPGGPGRGGSDYASFVCAGVPAFSLGSLSWDYGTYTWHTNRDTFDKLSFAELRNNATLTAMLAYLASEEPDRLPRRKRVMPPGRADDEPRRWPTCRDGARSGPRR